MNPKKPAARTLATALPLLALALLMAQAPFARADRPLVSETADALEKGSCVLDSAARRLRESGAPSVSSVGGVLGCGLFGTTQFLLGWQRASGGGVSAQGLTVGGKTNLVEVKDGQTGFGLAYGIGSVKVSGAGGSSGFRHDTTSLVGLATREVSKGVLGHANFGLSRSKLDDKTRAVWSIGFETTSDLSFAADIFGESGSRPNISAGVGYMFTPGWSVNFAVARALEAPRGTEASLGLRVAF
jgi:hypothetical protein